jgi:hypothetical protein
MPQLEKKDAVKIIASSPSPAATTKAARAREEAATIRNNFINYF